jgi:hypothetical protein
MCFHINPRGRIESQVPEIRPASHERHPRAQGAPRPPAQVFGFRR